MPSFYPLSTELATGTNQGNISKGLQHEICALGGSLLILQERLSHHYSSLEWNPSSLYFINLEMTSEHFSPFKLQLCKIQVASTKFVLATISLCDRVKVSRIHITKSILIHVEAVEAGEDRNSNKYGDTWRKHVYSAGFTY